MKFKDIKVGDEVLVSTYVKIGFNKKKRFFVTRKVERVTKTQFVVGGGRYRKTGEGIGDKRYCSVSFHGDRINTFVYKKGIALDQTEEMNAFVFKIKLERNLIERIERLSININSRFPKEELLDISHLLEQIELILNKKD